MNEKIILLRHTEAVGGNTVFRGQTDADLLPEGVKHAQKIARKLETLPIDGIYSSTLKRAIKTATPIAETHKLKLTKTPLLNEISFGIFDGLEKAEVMRKYRDIYEQRGKDMMNFRIPGGGESYTDVRKRALGFILSEAEKNPGKSLMFVVHGSLIKSILAPMMKDTPWEELGSMINYGCRIYMTRERELLLDRIEND